MLPLQRAAPVGELKIAHAPAPALAGRAAMRPMPVSPKAPHKRPMQAKGPTDAQFAAAYAHHNGAHYLSPTDLAITEAPLRRVAMVGTCYLTSLDLHKTNPANCPVDMIVTNNADGPGVLPLSEGGRPLYDFQVVQLALRSVLPDQAFWRIAYTNTARFEEALETTKAQIDFQLGRRLTWNVEHGLLTFVANFMAPQRNPMGALFPRFDIRNPEYFVQKVNEHLEAAVRRYNAAYILDLDRISQSLGRRYNQDDLTRVISHNSMLVVLRGVKDERIEQMAPLNDHFDVRWPAEFPGAVWTELMSMHRAVCQTDSVKMVVIDLDDTLWTGVIGEMTEVDPGILAPWQSGLVEALMWLKKRGILLAIISKNEESRVRSVWQNIFGKTLALSDFAAIRINWLPKPQNMREIMDAVSLLDKNVIFIDDNPAERSAMQQAFPRMRILGRYPYYLRQTLLWAPETQSAMLSEESSRRTEMIQAQVEREEHRRAYSTEDFLAAAAPAITLRSIGSTTDTRFARAAELVNKTNQFNTSGRRWAPSDWVGFFACGGRMYVFDVQDSYTAYGLVGVVLLIGDTIEQWVMSCRVLGYAIEDAVMAGLVATLRAAGGSTLTGKLVETEANFPCRNLFAKCGFKKVDGNWILERATEVVLPGHITLDHSV